MPNKTHILTDPSGNKKEITEELANSYSQGNNSLAAGYSVSPIQSPVQADQLSAPVAAPTPEAETPAQNEAFFDSLTGSVATARAELDTTLSDRKTKIDDELKTLKEEQKKILDDAGELTTPFREELQKKERERLFIEENFTASQRLTNELEGLLQEGNALIARQKGLPIHQRAASLRANRTIQDVEARAAVIQAVMNARNNQIAQAQHMIDRSIQAVVSDRQDALNYYQTLLDLNNNNILSLDAESKKIAEEQLNLVKGDLSRAEETADYIKNLMINPETAQFMAEAGVSLTDSVDQIKEKMAKQAKYQEAEDLKNTLVSQGFRYSPVPIEGDDVSSFDVGGQTMYFRRPVEELLGHQLQREQIATQRDSRRLNQERLDLQKAQVANAAIEKQIKIDEEQEKIDKSTAMGMTKANTAIGTIDKLLPRINFMTAGLGSYTEYIRGTAAADVSSDLDTLSAIVSFGGLQEMREASPTGGALGQVAVRELELLAALLGSFEQSQSAPQLKQNLGQARQHFANWKALVEADRTGVVTMVSEDGTVGHVPADEYEQALQEGYKLP